MSSKYDLVNIIRKTQTLVSVLLFLIVLIFFWDVTDFKIQEIQLSHWGGDGVKYSWLWNSIIILLSITILFNNIFFLKKHSRLKYKTIPYFLFTVVGVSLFMVGFFNLNHSIIHNIFAYIYFFLYPLSIFIMAHLNRSYLVYKEWLTHLLLSVIMMVVPLSFIGFFEGLAISETIHSIIVCSWNVIIAFRIFID
jgi:hypothetical membrane protein